MLQTAGQLWQIYVGLAAAESAARIAAGVRPFEAVPCVHDPRHRRLFDARSLAGAFGSPAIERIVTGFVLLAGMNLHSRLLARWLHEVWPDVELRYFLTIAAAGVFAVARVLLPSAPAPAEALRLAAFQLASILTTRST